MARQSRWEPAATAEENAGNFEVRTCMDTQALAFMRAWQLIVDHAYLCSLALSAVRQRARRARRGHPAQLEAAQEA